MSNLPEIFDEINGFIKTSKTKPGIYFTKPRAFTRDRKLSLENICHFMLSSGNCSLDIELCDYFKNIGKETVTKSAFSKARYKINNVFFEDFNRHTVSTIYKAKTGLKKWNNFTLKGIDGSTLYLVKDELIEKEFGTQDNQFCSVPMARLGFEIDLLNGYCTQATIQHYEKGENVFANAFLENSAPTDLLLYDRNFASFELAYKHIRRGVNFVIRIKNGWTTATKEFVESGKTEATIKMKITAGALKALAGIGQEVDKDSCITVRLLRIDIGKDEPEILMTSLLDKKKYPHECFKTLYNYRWGCETAIDKFKNKFQLASFSGHLPQAIYQDFYMKTIMANLHQLLVNDCKKEIEAINETSEVKKAINNNVTIGVLRKRTPKLFNKKTCVVLVAELKKIFISKIEPVRPGRSFPRVFNKRRPNSKYCTLKNYRRAA